MDRICDLTSDCIDGSDEKNCSTKTHFYCENDEPLFVPVSKVMDGNSDCSDLYDECSKEFYENDPFSSRQEMIANPILRYSAWIIVLISVTWNLCIICNISWSINKKNKPRIKYYNKVMLCNLAIADLLMGVALLMILCKSVKYSKQWCLEDQKWRIGNVCSAIGVLITISSESSILILVILISFRLKTVIFPLQTRTQKSSKVIHFLVIAWILGFFTAFFPYMGISSHIMSPKILLSADKTLNKYFGSNIVSFDTFQEYVVRISSLGNEPSIADLDYNSVNKGKIYMDFLHKYYPRFLSVIDGYFDYYSAHAVCMPRIYKTSEDQYINPFTVIIMSLNFISMIYISVAYIVLYFKSKPSRNINRTSSRTTKLQKKITVLLLTDFLCWFPICLISFISMTVKPVSNEIYAYSAIIQIPINSALNPIIYSNVIPNIKKIISKKIIPAVYGQ